jgi:glycine cleavage system aminomethyltransferase T
VVARDVGAITYTQSSIPGTSVEVEIFGEWVAGEGAAEPLYDPEGARLRS